MFEWQMFDEVEVNAPDNHFIGCIINWDDSHVVVQDETGQTFEYPNRFIKFIKHEQRIDKV